jgi:hypothetical protein
VRSVNRGVAGRENCCSVAMDSSESTGGPGTEMGWSSYVGEVGS